MKDGAFLFKQVCVDLESVCRWLNFGSRIATSKIRLDSDSSQILVIIYYQEKYVYDNFDYSGCLMIM